MYRLLKAHALVTSPACIVFKAANKFKDKTTAISQLWQTDFAYLKITGWGWYYLSTVLDDDSRYIVAWKLCSTMRSEDLMDTLDLALKRAGLDQVTVLHKPRLLSDNGSSYVAADLAEWLDDKKIEHYDLPGKLERQIAAFVEHYNHARYHESLDSLTPADIWNGRGEEILAERERIKRQTLANRRLQHQLRAAQSLTQRSQRLPSREPETVQIHLTTDNPDPH